MDGMVKPATSAYTFFQRTVTKTVKEELARTGMESDFGAVATAVSDRWRDMDTIQREPYEDMAKQDRERFKKEVRRSCGWWMVDNVQRAHRLQCTMYVTNSKNPSLPSSLPQSLARDAEMAAEQDSRRQQLYGTVAEGEVRGASKKTREEMEERERR